MPVGDECHDIVYRFVRAGLWHILLGRIVELGRGRGKGCSLTLRAPCVALAPVLTITPVNDVVTLNKQRAGNPTACGV